MEYDGDPALRARIEAALRRVVDPELAVDVLSLGLVYRVSLSGARAKATITMTSPACPVTELIVEDITHELGHELGMPVDVEVVWDPPWTPEMMSDRARKALGDL